MLIGIMLLILRFVEVFLPTTRWFNNGRFDILSISIVLVDNYFNIIIEA